MNDDKNKSDFGVGDLLPFLKKRIVHSPDGWSDEQVDSVLDTLAISMVMEESSIMFPVKFDDVVKWLDVRKDNLKRVLNALLRLNIDYVMLLLSTEEQRRGGHNKDSIMLTVRGAMKLCLLSKSKGASIMADFLLDIMDLFKAGLRDPSNSIFNKIRECVGIKMQNITDGGLLPDYSVKHPELPEPRKNISSGRMSIQKVDLSNNPIDTMRALRLGLRKDQHATFYDVTKEAALFMVHQYNEISRLESIVTASGEALCESKIDVECLRRELDNATGSTETKTYKNMVNQLRVQVDTLSLLATAKIEKLEPRVAFQCMSILQRATYQVPDEELEDFGNAVIQASIFSNAAQSKELSRIKMILDNVLGLLIYSHSSSIKRVDIVCTQQEQRLNTLYFEESSCYDDEPFNLITLSKLVRNADKKTKDAVYRYAVDNINTLPIEYTPIVNCAIEVYYGDASFAPYRWPTGDTQHGRGILVYFARGPISRPIDHHLICGGRIMTDGVDKALNCIYNQFNSMVWKGDKKTIPVMYTVESHYNFLLEISQKCEAILSIHFRNEIGAWGTL
jgi:hypothetical protein